MNSDVEYVQSTATFTYKFEGSAEIGATELAKTLESLASLVNFATVAEIPDAFARLNIRALEKGSFVIDLSAVVQTAKNLITPQGMEFAQTAIELLLAFFQIKQHIKGEPHRVTHTDAGIIVENNSGEIKHFVRNGGVYFKEPKIDILVVNCASAASGEGISGISLAIPNKEELKLSRSECKALSSPAQTEQIIRQRRIVQNEVILTIKKPDMLGSSKWIFKSGQNTIEASISDENWIDWFRESKAPICFGSQIKADLITTVELDDHDDIKIGTEKHEVVRVIGGIINPDVSEQTLMKY